MKERIPLLRSLLVIAGSAVVACAPSWAEGRHSGEVLPGRYIVVTRSGVAPETVARANNIQTEAVYHWAVSGFAGPISAAQIQVLKNDPRVWTIEPDRLVVLEGYAAGGPQSTAATAQPAQVVPTGVNRIDADLSTTAGIDGMDVRVNVDIAIIDTGIDLSHPDLNVVKNVTFVRGTRNGNDDNGHGSHTAGTAAAKDNNIGVVGVAPGARLWAVKVLDKFGAGTLSGVIAGVDYVTANAQTIDVANMSLGFAGSSDALNIAIANSVKAGVTYVVAAGNSAIDATGFSPANHPDVITVSAIADFNGHGGGGAPFTCRQDVDDTLADFSNYGAPVDIAAPGVCIYSTWKGGAYNTISGTSMASPHGAGAAALYKATNPSASPYAVKSALLSASSPQNDPVSGFSGDPDGYPEPMLRASGL